ncbi:MAG: glycosyltransferase [Methanogenium sp.]|jgi:glycosyltransferase involved in cell wall biosynthesis
MNLRTKTFQQNTYIPQNLRKTGLLLSDDIRFPSGVGVMSKEFVLGTAHHFNWLQVGGAVNHPDAGKLMNVSEDVNKICELTDSNVQILATNGYGTPDLIRQVLAQFKVDFILHFTDPRYWQWLYQFEHEFRVKIPLLFYHIWDDLPFPRWNEPFYESCDWISCISKQTYNIVKNVWKQSKPEPWQISYVPHGINEEIYFPIDDFSKLPPAELEKAKQYKKRLFGGEDIASPTDVYDFIMFHNCRNIRRKQTSDIVIAFKLFVEQLPPDEADRCALLMHIDPISDHGTDLFALCNEIAPDINVHFSTDKISPEYINFMLNWSDVSINISSNEGFGLGTAESLMAGTPIIVNVTGGLQDQCGFKKPDGKYITVEDLNAEWGSNHNGRYYDHGEWAFPVFPSNRSVQGSPLTPYIMDDRADFEDVANQIAIVYNRTRQERKRIGKLGREWMLRDDIGMSSLAMSQRMMNGINTTLEKWKPRQRYVIQKLNAPEKSYNDKLILRKWKMEEAKLESAVSGEQK